jgi:hypothetical protein
MLAIDPAGKFLYAAGAASLYVFAIDATAGWLSAADANRNPHSHRHYGLHRCHRRGDSDGEQVHAG